MHNLEAIIKDWKIVKMSNIPIRYFAIINKNSTESLDIVMVDVDCDSL